MKVFSRLTPIPQTALELDPFHHGLDLEQMLAQRDGEQDVPAYHLDILHARGDAGVGELDIFVVQASQAVHHDISILIPHHRRQQCIRETFELCLDELCLDLLLG